MEAEEQDRRGDAAKAIMQGGARLTQLGAELVDNLEADDFYQRLEDAKPIAEGVFDGASAAMGGAGGGAVAEENARQGMVVTTLGEAHAKIAESVGLADFDERVTKLANRLLDSAKTAKQALDLRPVGETGGAEWLSERLPTRPALLTRDGKPWLIQGKVGLLLAPGGTGKTWALLQLAVAVATGGKLFNTFDATKGRVLLALGEEDREEVQRRLFDVVKALGLGDYERAELLRNLTVWGLAGQDVSFLGRGAANAPHRSPWFDRLRQAVEAAGPWRCVLLDPWSRWGGPDVETDNHAATRGVELLEELTKAAGGATVLVAHHTRKKAQGEKTSGADADSSRGASGLVDGARWVANLERNGNNVLSLTVTKHNHTAPSDPVWLARTDNGPLRVATPDEVEDAKAKDSKTAGTGDGSTKPPARGGTTATTAPAKTPPGRGKLPVRDAQDDEIDRMLAESEDGAP